MIDVPLVGVLALSFSSYLSHSVNCGQSNSDFPAPVRCMRTTTVSVDFPLSSNVSSCCAVTVEDENQLLSFSAVVRTAPLAPHCHHHHRRH
ncbi:hypothetical protein PF005_g20079 [Phytophthora fragariae]|uniref:Secreted protein n=1 Tax=Phytophthora fragariae TaxID=53985 RepID=A0A6A3QZ24_9STRA|nr:hypothetical protein PF003_g11488 [Phytophthora fragariae]KAE8927838.1 hypothetical protein PF009_g22001 [Phytophthora fragariae]KAE8986838.1 hypothetical protein PF011_g19827 [Phytophthora fragariae]KAE9084034.1 hypothetical protein PF010_g20993 [Phytophthora fragariae]KAE9084180.1 hypothetical protein PF007_g21614 [Phytophthora fragariae]